MIRFDPSSNINSVGEDESKRIIVHEILSQNCSSNKDGSKQSIVSKTLSQNYSAGDISVGCVITMEVIYTELDLGCL